MPVATSTERLLEKVRKLLALATSDNVHEAALAASRAQSLIEQHRLQGILDAEEQAAEEAEQDPILDGRDDPLEATKRLRTWRVVLAVQLAELNGCIAYTEQSGRKKLLILAGRAADRAVVKELYAWLTRRLEWLSATHAPTAAQGGADKKWHEAFRIGAADVIAQRLASSRRARRQELEDDLGEAALVAVERGLASRSDRMRRYADEELRLKPGRQLRVNADGYARGKVAGARFELPE